MVFGAKGENIMGILFYRNVSKNRVNTVFLSFHCNYSEKVNADYKSMYVCLHRHLGDNAVNVDYTNACVISPQFQLCGQY